MKDFKKVLGHSLSEFGLIIGLVSVVGIGSLVALSQNVNGLLSNTIVTKSPNQTALTGQTTNPTSGNGNPLSSYSPNLPPPAPNQTQYCNQAGLCLNLYNVQPGQTADDVAGGNGGEKLILGYSDNLLRIRDYLATQGASNEILDLLTRMANNGHVLGGTYPGLMDQCREVKENPALAGVCIKDIKLTPEQFAARIDESVNISQRALIGAPHHENYFKLQNLYIDEVKPLLTNQSKENPAVKEMLSLVDYHYRQIKSIYESAAPRSMSILNKETQTLEVLLNQKNNAHLETVQESNAICQTGGDVKQCLHPVVPTTESSENITSVEY